ncbi:MAG: succinate dehydrogenase/fumarate reductase iron-sulfur subunit [Desulfobulbaceae bacterium]|nr:succinate dehydrogenase/fumarate reductase iron-sulfur subunit [Candidatus Kapabacteria bacterium]MBS4000032.1 succinate dehydrogenase/fumarate reductase iron-sulfur subunit [Desulfobulbaceae bacterium]
MKLTLNIWRQKDKNSKGQFENYNLNEVSPDMSFLEMLDVLNEDLLHKGDEPVAFDHDCREGICGACSMTINGRPHGPEKQTTTCQLHMRKFNDGETITIEPFRAKPFPVIRDLIVDRTSFDRIQQAGGFVSVNTGSSPDSNAVPIAKVAADKAFDAAACIGCGACVAACPNGAAMLFTSAKIGQFALLPQGQPERKERVIAMVKQMDSEGFGACTNHYECEAACPKGISVEFIAMMNRDFMKASFSR